MKKELFLLSLGVSFFILSCGKPDEKFWNKPLGSVVIPQSTLDGEYFQDLQLTKKEIRREIKKYIEETFQDLQTDEEVINYEYSVDKMLESLKK